MKKILLLVILIVIVLIFGWLFKIIFLNQNGNGEIEQFQVSAGQGVNEISSNLKKQGLIDNSFVFETYIWFKKYESRILAGNHRIKNNLSIRQLVNTLISGSSIDNEITLTFLEGWNLRNISDYLQNQGIIDHLDDLYFITGQPAVNYNLNPELPKPKNFYADYQFLKGKPANLSLEGFLFPDTYRFFKGATAESIVRKMLDNFGKKFNADILAEIDRQGKTLHEIITLASIIEKEGNTLENKKRVAGVYYNRLAIGMALQADPTVNYVTEKSTDRPSFDDIKTDNLYNTYLYPGLPPGPICNPGMNSIMAAIYPDKNDYYFFINTPTGEMVFGRNFEEHKANRAKYFNN